MADRPALVLDILSGSFLVSTHRMPDPRFEEMVIYICGHSHEGAMGLAVNKPSHDLTLAEILRGADMTVPGDPDQLPPVYCGGPVEVTSPFILFSSEYQAASQLSVSSTVSLSRDKRVLEDISLGRGPAKYLFLMGYTGWGPGQLERELVEDGWLMVPADDAIIFDTDDEQKWKAAAQRHGIDITVFGDVPGYA